MRIRCWLLSLMLAAFSMPSIQAQEGSRKASKAEADNQALSKVQPEYPAVARQLKIQGTVELEAEVDEAGAVAKVNIVSGNPVLTKPAVEALKKWRFRPFTSDGKAVTTMVPVSIAFKL